MKREHQYYIYIITNKPGGVLYIGVTNDLVRRVSEHREGEVSGFTQKYKLKHLVYFEQTDTIEAALQREKNLKNWHRQWKINLIEESNPGWKDLLQEFF